MEKKDLGEVKTAIRMKNGAEQIIRLFTKSQRRLIMEEVDNRPDNMIIEDVLKVYDVNPAVYYNWARNVKEDLTEEKEVVPNPLLSMNNYNLYFPSNQIKEFYLQNSSELNNFLDAKFKEWLDKDLIAQFSSKITSENIAEVAKAGNITIDELDSFLLRENMNLSYFSVEAMKKFLGI